MNNMALNNICNIFLLSILFFEVIAKRDFVLKIKDVKCQSRSRIVNITCTETKSSRVAGLNMYVWLTDDIRKMRYNLNVLHLNKDKEWENFFKLSNLNVCEFLSATFSAPILLIVRNLMRQFSNFPEQCPIKKDTFYYIEKMKLDPKLFPPYFPEGEFLATGELYDENITFLDYALGIQIEAKNSKKLFQKNNVSGL